MIIYFLKVHPDFGGDKIYFDCICEMRQYISNLFNRLLKESPKLNLNGERQTKRWQSSDEIAKEEMFLSNVHIVRIDTDKVDKYEKKFRKNQITR